MIQYVFMAIGFTVTVLNLLVFLAVRRRLKVAFPERGGLVASILAAPYWLLLHPPIVMMFGGVDGLMAVRDGVPQALLIASMTLQFAAWVYGGLLLIKATGALVWRAARKFRGKDGTEEDPKDNGETKEIDMDRRRALQKAALALPVAIIATSVGGAVAARQIPQVTRIRLKVPKDRTNLHGVTFAQVSDVHVGSYMDRGRLDEIRDAMNALNVDFHVVTGDLLDNHPNQLEESTNFLSGLKPRRGEVFMCMGNHEYIAARRGEIAPIIDGLRDTGTQLLIDETQKINIGGDHFWIGGIDYPMQAGLPGERRTRRESLELVTGEMGDDGTPRIVLAHHPRSFEIGREMPLDLMLSGHTHGGQISLGRIGNLEITPVLPFEYFHNGHYEHEGRRLYVNAGAGGWMPVRINCPPEITVVELVS